MQPTFVPVAPQWWVSNFGGLVVNGIMAARRKSRLTRAVFATAVAIHVVEAVYTYRVATREGLDEDAWKWTLQTLGVGFPSLLALHALLAAREEAMELEG